ncbi:MAG: sulfur carrier protein ThiS adenylyltransferase ThiF [Pelovirga sp.]
MGIEQIHIVLNERSLTVNQGTRLRELQQEYSPHSDLLIVNGYPCPDDKILKDQDHIVMIRRGIAPAPEELEALIMSRHTPGVHEKVKKARVGIAGAGGLGSAIAIALTRTGVGFIRIVDFDVVEPSNLNRQQYFIDQIGMPKVAALRDNLQRINPLVELDIHHSKVTVDNLKELFGDVDILVEAFDRADQKAMLANGFLRHCPGKYLIAASGMAGHKPANSIQTHQINDFFYLCGDHTTAAEPGCGLMAPRVGIAAHHQANAVLRLILGENPAAEEH